MIYPYRSINRLLRVNTEKKRPREVGTKIKRRSARGQETWLFELAPTARAIRLSAPGTEVGMESGLHQFVGNTGKFAPAVALMSMISSYTA